MVGKTKHPTIAKFWRESAYHERLGITVDPRPLSKRPHKEVEEYEVLMQLTAQKEAQEARSRASG